MSDLADLFPGYQSHWIDTSAGKIFARTGGQGPPLLLLHGYAETNVMWHAVAPALAEHFSLVIPDLPGYGWSAVPESGDGHAPYDKRSMANAMVEAMEKLGHARFRLAGHDRGGRTTDLANDEADRAKGNKITCPMLALWGAAGIPSEAEADPLATWREWANDVRGFAIESGHYLPEENPAATAKALIEFFK